MRSSWARFLAVPTVAVGIAAGVTVAAPAAFAQSDTSGTVAVTVPFSYIAQLAKAGVVAFPVPLSELSVDKSAQTVTITFNVTGGNGDVSVFFGQVNLSGTLTFATIDRDHHKAAIHHREVTVGSLDLNLANGVIEGIPAGSSTPVPLLDLNGNISDSVNGTSETYGASELDVDPAGAAYLNNALHATAFTAGQNTGGSLAASWTFA
jgi:hypothetical protein